MPTNSDHLKLQQFKKKNLYTIFITNIIHGFGFSMFNVVYQPYLYEITQSEVILGYLATFGMLMQLLPMQLSGKIADKHGRKSLILIGLSMIVVGLIIIVIFQELVLIISGITLIFLGYGIRDPPKQIFTRENSEDKKHGLMFSLMFFGYFAGSIGGNLMVTYLGKPAQFYFGIFAGIIILQIFIQFFFLKEEKSAQPFQSKDVESVLSEETVKKDLKSESSWITIFKNPKNRRIIIFFLVDSMIWGISLSIYTGALVANYSLTKEQIGVIIIIFNISNMIFQIPCGHLVDKIGKKWSLFLGDSLGFVIFGFALLGWVFRDQYLMPFLYAAHFVLGIVVSVFLPAQMALLSNLDKKKPTEYYGIMNLILALGFMPMGLISGLIIAKVHYIAPFIITLLLIPLELLYLVKIFPNDK
ncbi:MFS transporter [Promethearchaeum syntrophicum]|uniref:MFS transporter n=1 Tax=Promethearchaeum syntrophicum TaxID=2594042 RepID=A0A5B9D6G0_9ARCH